MRRRGHGEQARALHARPSLQLRSCLCIVARQPPCLLAYGQGLFARPATGEGGLALHTLVIYDIPSTKIRNKIAEACMDYGLDRIQWSAFLGDINHNRREELEARLKKVLGRRAGNIQLFPVCEKDLGLRVIIEVRKEDEKKDDDDKSKKRRRRKKKQDEATQTREKTEGSDAEAKVTHEPGETGDGMQAEENLEPKRGREGGRA